MVKVPRSIVPSFFTVGNMFCGFYSVIAAFQGMVELAAWMIVAGAFLDAMDGKVARFTNSSSQFGVEYDSLADVITFGFAPSFLIFTIFGNTLGIPGILLSFMPLLFGSIRLARFNTQLKGFDKEYFSGLPIPTAAITLSSFILFSKYLFAESIKFPKMMIILILCISVLMVSTIRYETAPDLNFKGNRKEKTKFVILILAVIIIIIFPHQTLFPLILLYILTGLVSWIFRLNKNHSRTEQDGVNIESKN
jgi:CDP-diacylglycerol--serine O-phosphatidyltransferase